MHAVEADFEVLVNAKETAYEPDPQGFNNERQREIRLNYLPHQWV